MNLANNSYNPSPLVPQPPIVVFKRTHGKTWWGAACDVTSRHESDG